MHRALAGRVEDGVECASEVCGLRERDCRVGGCDLAC